MPVHFEKLVSMVRERAELDHLPLVTRSEDGIDNAVVERLVLYTINAMGFHVCGRGEVHDPRPQNMHIPEQRGVHWLGGRKRR